MRPLGYPAVGYDLIWKRGKERIADSRELDAGQGEADLANEVEMLMIALGQIGGQLAVLLDPLVLAVILAPLPGAPIPAPGGVAVAVVAARERAAAIECLASWGYNGHPCDRLRASSG
jgi:hypothetical protein